LRPAELAALVYGADGRWCAGTSPETWFPEEPRRASGRRDPGGEKFAAAMDAYETKARAACRFCPVELACLELAIQMEGSRPPAGCRYADRRCDVADQDIRPRSYADTQSA
jgi:hypothetical protein